MAADDRSIQAGDDDAPRTEAERTRDISNLAEPIPTGEDPQAGIALGRASNQEGNGSRPVLDTSVPNVARMYDFLLGGKEHFASDREAAAELMKAVPDIAAVCRFNREFLWRAVRFLASGAGIRQFIDIGTGLPTQGSVHEVAQAVEPATRVLYVDNDPVVVSHAQALLVNAPTVVAINKDLRYPRQIMEHPALQALIDMDKPVAVLLIAVLHFIPDNADPYGIVDELKAAMPAGSYLVLSHATGDDVPAEVTDQVRQVYSRANAPAAPRTSAEITRFFDGLELIGPGLADVRTWPDQARPDAARTIFLAGIGRKP
jgi:hypothetical protein